MKKMNSLTPEQMKATDPTLNVWIQANAGTGKTRVLVQRLLRILFRGNGENCPGILCLTYTKAGASEMRNRTLAELQKWALASDEKLTELLSGITDTPTVTKADLSRARQIFFYYIDNQDVLKIKTIHAFCEEILRRYPLEAGLSPSWSTLSDADRQTLINNVFDKVITHAKTDTNTDKAITRILDMFSEYTIDTLYKNLLSICTDLSGITDFVKYRKYFIDTTINLLNLTLPKNTKIGESELKNILIQTQDFANLQKSPAKYIQNIIIDTQKFIDKTIDFEKYKLNYLTGEDNTPRQNIATGKCQWLKDEQERVYEVDQYNKRRQIADNSLAMLDLAIAFLTEYNRIKSERNLLDFNDMIAYTYKLFSDPKTMGWVLSQMDIGLGYILMDEAQDTSRTQWANFNLLQEDFFTDGSDTKNPRTIFVVGDTKQSIFGFQGADPDAFNFSQQETTIRLKENMRELHKIELEQNFRSTAPILSVVDTFFNTPAIAEKTHFNKITHKSYRQEAGLVEIHRQSMSRKTKDIPEDRVLTQDEYIDAIVARVQYVLQQVGANGKKYTPSDIMILLYHRGSLAPKIITKLQQAKIKVTGSDRISLPDFLAIRDLMRLVRFCLNNADDYSLCCLLKSPICGLKEQDIFNICNKRNAINITRKNQNKTPVTIFELLQDMYPEIYVCLEQYISKSKILAPYSFFTYVLNNENVRQNMLAEFGPQLIDPLEEFMTQCLSYERTQSGTLKHFIKWFINTNNVIKRDMDTSDGVRVMTIHGSKGLQAPVVFLVDTTSKPKPEYILPIKPEFFPKNVKYSPNMPLPWLWYYNAQSIPESLTDIVDMARASRMDEYYRLLYVAMTRAEERLYIYGHGGSDKANQTWHSLIWQTFANDTDADTITITEPLETK